MTLPASRTGKPIPQKAPPAPPPKSTLGSMSDAELLAMAGSNLPPPPAQVKIIDILLMAGYSGTYFKLVPDIFGNFSIFHYKSSLITPFIKDFSPIIIVLNGMISALAVPSNN